MKFVLTAGGTAGHINPAIALAEELTTRGHEIIFAGTPDHLEATLVPQAGFKFQAFEASGFNRRHPLTLIKAVSSINKSTHLAKRWLADIKPDAVIGFGCYVSLAICRAANSLKIPIAIHEQNSVMGMANKYLCGKAAVTCLTYEHAKNEKSKRSVVVGNPVRRDFLKITREEGRHVLNIPADAKFLVCFGGSLGAAQLNKAMVGMSQDLLKNDANLYIMHLTGKKQFDQTSKAQHLDDNYKERYIMLPYQDKMAETLAAADMCISRAGASSLAEIAATCKPALLVPYPYATGNHQYYNAKSLIDDKAALMVSDDEVQTSKFSEAVSTLVNDGKLRCDMISRLKKLEADRAAAKLADELIKITGE